MIAGTFLRNVHEINDTTVSCWSWTGVSVWTMNGIGLCYQG